MKKARAQIDKIYFQKSYSKYNFQWRAENFKKL